MKIGKFFRIWKKSAALEIQESMTYKIGFMILLISLFLGDILIPIISVVIYSVSKGIPGWTLAEFVLFQGTLILVIGIWHTLFSDLLGQTTSLVHEGSFDKILLRPFSSLGLMTANSFDADGFAEIAAGLIIVGWALTQIQFLASMIIPYILIILLAVLFEYALTIIAASLAFIFTRTWRLFEIINIVEKFSRYPASIYGPGMRFFLTFLIPAGVAAFYPASVLLGKQPLLTAAWIVLPVVAIFIISIFIWKFSMKRYSSAGG